MIPANEIPPVSPFDELARGYDADFTDSPVGRALRGIVWSRLDILFRPSQRVLELGCGTAEDAVHLARQGIRIVATDASREMTEIARRKAQACGCDERIEFHQLPMEGIGAALAGQQFDGTFSNFGAINCVDDLSSLGAALAQVLRPGAPLVWVVMGRHVPWEWGWYVLHGEGRKALRRYRRNGVEWHGLRIKYPAPGEVAAALQPHFATTRISPLGCVLPPSYAAGWLNRSPRMFAALTRLEMLTQHSSLLASCSDHYVLEARRL